MTAEWIVGKRQYLCWNQKSTSDKLFHETPWSNTPLTNFTESSSCFLLAYVMESQLSERQIADRKL